MIPAIWTLNFRDLAWLENELTTWTKKLKLASGPAKPEIKTYVDAVTAERDQRAEQYKTTWGTLTSGPSAIFEGLFGGSGGKGAAGLPAGVADTVGSAASGAMSIVNKVLVVLTLAGGIYLYTKLKKK